MAISKVILNSDVQMDITDTTATQGQVASTAYYYGADGVKKQGSYVVPSAVTPAPEKDVNFIDYDGTILYSYSKAEFASLSALPANPTHTGLTAQGWNWSLSDAKTYAAANGKLWIGQMYVTTSSKTEIDVELGDAGLLSPYLKIAVNGTVTIDWGDGSTADTVTGTSLTTAIYTQHTYAAVGTYTISIGVTSGRFTFYSANILTSTTASGDVNRRYNSSIVAVRLGSGITSLGSNAFYNCALLRSVTMPSTVTSIGESAFQGSHSLQCVTIPMGVTSLPSSFIRGMHGLRRVSFPSGITSIGSNFAVQSYALQSVAIPSGVTAIPSSFLSNCTSLQEITIPSGVTSIAAGAFGTTVMYKIVFKPTSPPTVAASSAWTSLPTDCIIYVPYSADHSIKNLYTSANNYPSSSTYTYVEET